MTIVPGFVDTHAHWIEIRRGVLDLQNWSFFANLAYGVTTGRDPQTGTNDMFAYQDLVETGELVGPRAFSTGPGVFSDTDFQSAEEVEGVVARYKKYYRTNTLKSYMIGNRRQRQWMIEACRKNEVMPTTEGGLDLKLNLTHALDGFSGNEHSLPVVPLFADVVELFARTGISYTPTLLVAYGGPFGETYFFTTTTIHDDPKIRRFIPHDDPRRQGPALGMVPQGRARLPMIAASAAKIARAGGHVCIGSHGEMQGIGYHWEMWALASGGWKPHRSPPRGHAARRRGHRLRPGSRQHRDRQARRPGRAGERPARGHPQHELDPLRDEERRAVRGRHARPDLAGPQAAAAAVVVGGQAGTALVFAPRKRGDPMSEPWLEDAGFMEGDGIPPAEPDRQRSVAVRRRAILQGLAALGVGSTVFHRAVAAQVARSASVTPEMIKQAEWIAGLDLTDDERETTARSLEREPRGRSPSCARSTSATTCRLP